MQKEESEYLDFLLEQYKLGYADKIVEKKLLQHGYIQSDKQVMVDKYEYNSDKLPEFYSKKYPNDIRKEDWLPTSTTYHTDEFYNWINSITYGFFVSKVYYEPFELYKAQAYKWLGEKVSVADINDFDLQMETIQEEYRRIDENTLYFANKYGMIKEGNLSTGIMRYTAKEHNAVTYFLCDCGYSLLLGKPRQIYLTTTLGMFAVKKCITQRNFFMKFITENDATGLEIFNDKIKYPFAELPYWLKPEVLSDRENKFWLGQKNKKGEVDPPNTRIEVVAPYPTAINGGSPQLVLIDEVGNIPILTEMITEARPTMFIDKNSDGNLEMRRQILCWGTGVSDKKGKGAFRNEWFSTLNLWEEKNNKCGFVPLFFSWHCRCTESHYKSEKEVYYSGKNAKDVGLEDRKIMFHQHYPSTFNDMFTSTSGKLISSDKIIEGLKRIRENKKNIPFVYGYFEPVYDYQHKENENSDTPFKIVDSKFVACDDESMDMATTLMIVPPNSEYKDRYYQGTDPISVETGKSFMCSIIHDDYLDMPVCMMNYKKTHDHKYVFLQSLLMGIYYDVEHDRGLKHGVKELIESNAGQNYIDYKYSKGYGKSTVYNAELPDPARGGGGRFGVDNRGSRALFIISKLREYLNAYNDNIYLETIYRQLDTFGESQTTKTESWGSINKKLYPDDALFALAFAYICKLSYPYKTAKKITSEENAIKRVKKKIIRNADLSLTYEKRLT